MNPETSDYINDQIRLSTDSAIQANTQILHFIQTSLSDLHKRFDTHNSEMSEEVKKVIKETVNGKIDRMSAKLDTHIEKVEPMLEVFEKNKIVKMELAKGGKLILKTAGGVVTLGAAWMAIKSLASHIW